MEAEVVQQVHPFGYVLATLAFVAFAAFIYLKVTKKKVTLTKSGGSPIDKDRPQQDSK